jgi:hypothetical protein
VAITKQQILAELRRCGNDPVYFINKYVKIRHPTRGLIPFAMYDYQEELVRDYVEHRFNVILKARQLGISEVTAAFAAWLMIFRRQRTVLCIATKADVAKNLLKKIHTALRYLPKWMMSQEDGGFCRLVIENKTSLELSNGSVAKALASKEDAGHSEAVSFFIVDEASRIPNLDEIWKGIYHTVQTGGRIAMISTPNGVGGLFHQIYDDAVAGTNDFHPTKLMWWVHPEHIRDGSGNIDLVEDPYRPGFKTSSWFREETKGGNLSPRQIAEQYECNFNSSGHTVIGAEYIERIATEEVHEPVKKLLPDAKWHLWNEALPGDTYFITADVARGDGRDYSAAHVWKPSPDYLVQVSEYYEKIPVDGFADVLCQMGKYYNNALLVIENNSLGLAVLEHVRLKGYSNVYFSRRGDMKPGEAVNMQWGSLDPDLVPGFTTSAQRKALMIAKLEEYIRNRTILIKSRRLLEEIRTFVWLDDKRGVNAKAGASTGRNDDLFMAASMGAWICDTFISPAGVGLELQRQMLDSIGMNRNVNTQIVGASKDPRFAPQRMIGVFLPMDQSQQSQIRLPNGVVADFSWVINKG